MAVAEVKAEETLPYDDALLIKIKGKPKKPVKPDDSERNIQIQKLQAEITRHNDRITAVSELINSRKSSAQGVSSGSQDLRQQLNAHRSEKQQIVRSKQRIRDEFQEVVREKEAIKAELRSIRDKVKVNVDSLEKRIEELEFRLTHETLSKADEQRQQAQLSQYILARPFAKQVTGLETRLAQLEEQRKVISARLSDCDQSIAVIDDAMAGIDAYVAGERAKEQEQLADVPSLIVERKECYDIVKALRDKIGEIRRDYDVRYQEFVKLDKNYNAYLRYEKKKRYEERAKETQERQKEQQAELTPELLTEPFESEVFVCDQMIAYLKRTMGTEEASSKEAVKAVEAPSGMRLFKRKDEDDDLKDLYSVNTKKGKKTAAEKPASEKKSQKLNHTLEMLKTFMSLGVDVPQTTADLPATLVKVEAKKVEYLEKRAVEKANPRGRSKPAAAAVPEEQDAEDLLEADVEGDLDQDPRDEALDPELEASKDPEEEVAPEAAEPVEVAEEQVAEVAVEAPPSLAVEEEEAEVAEAAVVVEETKLPSVAAAENGHATAEAEVDAEAAEAEVEAVEVAPAVKSVGPASDVGVALQVDDVSDEISVKLVL